MKGILLLGGAGTRLHPVTKVINKHLLPIYNKPMVYYSLSVLVWAGIKDILLICTPNDLSSFQELLGDGSAWGVRLHYATQRVPKGIAEALIIGEPFLNGDSVCLVLGDNIFYGSGLEDTLQHVARSLSNGALIFDYYVSEPNRYGVVVYNDSGIITDVIEKPQNKVSNFAIPGIYFFDKDAPLIAKELVPSKRGELEITDVVKDYLYKKKLTVMHMGPGIAWLDTGTFDSLLDASMFISTLEKRQGIYIAHPKG